MLTLSVCVCIWLFIVSLSHPMSALLALVAESDIHCLVTMEFGDNVHVAMISGIKYNSWNLTVVLNCPAIIGGLQYNAYYV